MEFEGRIPSIMGPEYFVDSKSGGGGAKRVRKRTPEAAHVDHKDLIKMNETQLLNYLTEDLLNAETKLYGKNDAEAKIIFLGGGPTHDISKATTFEGTPIYKETPDFAKWSEMYEFMGAANRYTDDKGSLSEFVSEAADVIYNLAVLSKIDTYEHAYDYTEMIERVAVTLGWTPKEALLVAATKYHQRFVHSGEKDSVAEDDLMERLLEKDILFENTEPLVTSPSKKQVSNAFNLGTTLLNAYLIPRYHQIRDQKLEIVNKTKTSKK